MRCYRYSTWGRGIGVRWIGVRKGAEGGGRGEGEKGGGGGGVGEGQGKD